MPTLDERIEAARKLDGHTPGPWDASGLTVYDTCMDGVASCHTGADARLIAAAPDLHRLVLDLAAEIERLLDREAAAIARADAAEAAVAEVERMQKALFDTRHGSFDEAFAEARKLGLKEFIWRGHRYHTRTREEREEEAARAGDR